MEKMQNSSCKMWSFNGRSRSAVVADQYNIAPSRHKITKFTLPAVEGTARMSYSVYRDIFADQNWKLCIYSISAEFYLNIVHVTPFLNNHGATKTMDYERICNASARSLKSWTMEIP
jgi:hypothetical protein